MADINCYIKIISNNKLNSCTTIELVNDNFIKITIIAYTKQELLTEIIKLEKYFNIRR